jgi:hypothetical protein
LLHRGNDFAFQSPSNGRSLDYGLKKPHEGTGRVVLNNLSEGIRECLQHAEDCARKAATQTDPALRDDFLRLEKRWLDLARSMEFAERLSNFTKNSAKPNSKFNGKFNI